MPTAVNRVMSTDGVYATTGVSWTLPSPATNAVLAFTTPSGHLDSASWNTGDYTLRINITTANMSISLTRLLVRRLNSAGVLQATLVDETISSALCDAPLSTNSRTPVRVRRR